MKILARDAIVEQVIKNLLLAHKKIADSGNVNDLIYLSKYLMRLTKKFNNIIIEISTEEVQKENDYPPDYSS